MRQHVLWTEHEPAGGIAASADSSVRIAHSVRAPCRARSSCEWLAATETERAALLSRCERSSGARRAVAGAAWLR
jgi:hypothetical protein